MTPKPLTSASNPRVKQARKLHARRHRERLGLFLAEGPHLVEAALNAGAPLPEAFCTDEFLEREAALAARLIASPVPLWVLPAEVMASVAATEHPQGLVAVAAMPGEAQRPAAGPQLLALALEGVADPGNVGVALRAARAAGAVVLLGPGCCDRFNPKAVRASAGAIFGVSARGTDDLAGLLGELRSGGAQIVVTRPRAERPCWAVDLTGATVIVVGSEARGVGEATGAMADEQVAIPMPGGGESLNAGAAAGVLLYEALRQRMVSAH